jgi:hypothetical protein
MLREEHASQPSSSTTGLYNSPFSLPQAELAGVASINRDRVPGPCFTDSGVLQVCRKSGNSKLVTHVTVAIRRADWHRRIGMDRNGRHDGKGKGDYEQYFSHTPSVIVPMLYQNEIHEVFCFQKTESAAIRNLSRAGTPPEARNKAQAPAGIDIW